MWLCLAQRGRRLAYQPAVLADCRIEARNPIADLRATLDVFERFGRSHVISVDMRRVLRTRTIALLDRLDVELAKRYVLNGDYARRSTTCAAPRRWSLRLALALLVVRVTPRLARWMFVLTRVPA